MKPNESPSATAALALLRTFALLLLMSGCASTSPPSPPVVVKPPQIPPLPSSARQTSERSEPYSRRAERNIEAWHEMLTSRSTTPAGAAASAPRTTTP